MDPDPPSLLLSLSLILPVLTLLLLVFSSALVSGSEVAFFSFSPTDIEELKKSDTTVDKEILKMLEMPNNLLGTILISNNFINITIVILSSIILTPLLSSWASGGWVFSLFGFNLSFSAPEVAFTLQLILVTFTILLFGEILPKIYANKNGLQLARLMVKPMNIVGKLVNPLNRILQTTTKWISPKARSENLTVTDLEHALDLTEDHDIDEQKILRGIVKFGSITARQIMTPRPDVVALDVLDNYDTLMKVVKDSGFSRIPIFKESFDQIKGTLYIKDLLPYIDESNIFNWKKLIRDPFFVPENKKIDDLLKEFQEKKTHMAVVVDEFGGTSGIITLEDILEEIVGDISDEFDAQDIVYSKLDDKNFVFEGKTSIPDFCSVLEIEEDFFDEVKGDAESIAGLFLEIAGKFPVKGEEVKYEGFCFKIESIEERRIQQVKITLP